MPTAKKRRGDPLIWAARRLHQSLASANGSRNDCFASAMQTLLQQQDQVTYHWRRACIATGRGWHAAAAAERQRIIELIDSRHHYVSDLLDQQLRSAAPDAKVMTLSGILLELRQLQEEFDQVIIEPRRGCIAVVTRPVKLRDIRLGRFRIELYMDRLRERHDASAIDCVALDPNPASTSEETTHPHVRDNVLCAGDATMPLQAALRTGRVCDAFLLINSVLHTYNASSPYVSLDEWHGIACADCGYTADEESMFRCEHCEEQVCESCVGSCDGCDGSYCQSCLDRTGEEYLCPACRTTCPRCDQIVAAAEVKELGMCRTCHEEEEQELERQEQEDHECNDTNDNNINDDAAASDSENCHINGDGGEGQGAGHHQTDEVVWAPAA